MGILVGGFMMLILLSIDFLFYRFTTVFYRILNTSMSSVILYSRRLAGFSINYDFIVFCVGGSKAKSVLYFSYSTVKL